jgi:hypothetical protein
MESPTAPAAAHSEGPSSLTTRRPTRVGDEVAADQRARLRGLHFGGAHHQHDRGGERHEHQREDGVVGDQLHRPDRDRAPDRARNDAQDDATVRHAGFGHAITVPADWVPSGIMG